MPCVSLTSVGQRAAELQALQRLPTAHLAEQVRIFLFLIFFKNYF
jgi:hypothetical protein